MPLAILRLGVRLEFASRFSSASDKGISVEEAGLISACLPEETLDVMLLPLTSLETPGQTRCSGDCSAEAAAPGRKNLASRPDAATKETRIEMTAEEWIQDFCEEVGEAAPSEADREAILRLAAVAAHASERIAAPMACWVGGASGKSLSELVELAEKVGSG
jgi:hypothetical protein